MVLQYFTLNDLSHAHKSHSFLYLYKCLEANCSEGLTGFYIIIVNTPPAGLVAVDAGPARNRLPVAPHLASLSLELRSPQSVVFISYIYIYITVYVFIYGSPYMIDWSQLGTICLYRARNMSIAYILGSLI